MNPSTPTPINVPQVVPVPPKKTSPIFLIVLILLFLASTSAAGYFYFQNQQLNNQLTILQQQNIQPTPTPTPTDPTADWKTYINTKNNFAFKYPSNWSIRAFAGSGQVPETADSFILEGPYKNLTTLEGGPDFSIRVDVFNSRPNTTDISNQITSTKENGILFIKFTYQSLSAPPTPLTDRTIFDQILSTFKFIPSPTGVAPEYTCPTTGWVDCMPILDEAGQKRCSPTAMTWYQANCPDFQGGAL